MSFMADGYDILAQLERSTNACSIKSKTALGYKEAAIKVDRTKGGNINIEGNWEVVSVRSRNETVRCYSVSGKQIYPERTLELAAKPNIIPRAR
jgi:hypothetical protein